MTKPNFELPLRDHLSDIRRLLDKVEPFNDAYRAACKRLAEGEAETDAVVSLLDLTDLAFTYVELRKIYHTIADSPPEEE